MPFQGASGTPGFFNLHSVDFSSEVTAAANLTDNAVVVGDGGAKGVKTLAALGAAGTVLMSNGAGVPPSFQSVTNADPTMFDATIGAAGATYTTVSAALAAGKSRLLQIDNVTETADCAIPSTSLFIFILKGKTLDFATNSKQFTAAGAYQLMIVGQSREGSEIDYAFASAKPFVSNTLGDTYFTNLSIVNSSTHDSTPVTNGIEHYSNTRVFAANHYEAGISLINDASNVGPSTLQNVLILGGGASCDSPLLTNGNVIHMMDTIIFSGTFASGGGNAGMCDISSCNISNLLFDHSGTGKATINALTQATGLYEGYSGTGLNLIFEGSVRASQVTLDSSGAGTITISGSSGGFISNFTCTTLTDNASTLNYSLTNGIVANATTVSGDFCKYTNIQFVAGVAHVLSGADNNGFSNCLFGNTTSGGTETITIDAGSNNTRVGLCTSDAAISDAGTGSVLIGNTVH